jgi:hypothetical protein
MYEGTVVDRGVLENAATKSFGFHGLCQHPWINRSPTRIILVAISHAPNLLVGITRHSRNVPHNVRGNEVRRVQVLDIHGLHCFRCSRMVFLGNWRKKSAGFEKRGEVLMFQECREERCCIERKKENCDLRGILNDKEIASQVVGVFKNVLSKVYRSLPKMRRSMWQEYCVEKWLSVQM